MGPTCDICGKPIPGKVARSKRTGKTFHPECAQQQGQRQQEQEQEQEQEEKATEKPASGGSSGTGGTPVRPECSICGKPIMETKFLSNANGERMHKVCHEQEAAAKRKSCGFCGKPIKGNYVTGPCYLGKLPQSVVYSAKPFPGNFLGPLTRCWHRSHARRYGRAATILQQELLRRRTVPKGETRLPIRRVMSAVLKKLFAFQYLGARFEWIALLYSLAAWPTGSHISSQ